MTGDQVLYDTEEVYIVIMLSSLYKNVRSSIRVNHLF